jgi:2-polyprenyl-3-methyl-5-hydroxy-6-metoxy-1,4-benzoquinol methylase
MTSPRPQMNECAKYYSSDAYISHSDTSRGLINKLYHLVRNFTLKQKVKLIQSYSKTPHLLDIGSGAGYFLDSCRRNGILAKGIEPDATTRNRSINNFGIDVFDEAELDKMEDSGFDVITMWHVLEHVEELNTRVQQIQRLLKEDGLLILALPNCSSFDARHYKQFWAGYDVPRHLWHFTPDTISKLLNKSGFEVFSTLPMYFDAFYVSMLSEKYRQNGLGFINGMMIGLISNLKAAFSRKHIYSSQIYLIKKK